MRGEITASVQRHECWLNDRAAAEVENTQRELRLVMQEHDSQLQQLAMVPRSALLLVEARFKENAEHEMKQYEGFLTMHCHSEHREQMENSIRIIQKFF